MKDIYIAYSCNKCGLVFIITNIDNYIGQETNKYLACPYGHRNIKKLDAYEGMNECMNQKYSTLI